MNDADSLYMILAVAAVMIVPFLLGKFVKSKVTGLLLLSALPVLFAILGVIAYFDSANSDNQETRDWAGIWLVIPILAAILEGLGIVGWLIGRATRHRPSATPVLRTDGPIYSGSTPIPPLTRHDAATATTAPPLATNAATAPPEPEVGAAWLPRPEMDAGAETVPPRTDPGTRDVSSAV